MGLGCPTGVLGVILAIQVLTRVFKVDYGREARQLKEMGGSAEDIVNVTLRVTRADVAGVAIGELVKGKEWHALFSRLRRGDEEVLVKASTTLCSGDLVSVIGTVQMFEPFFLMGGPGFSTRTLSLYTYQLGFQTLNLGYGAAVSLIIFVLLLFATVFQLQRWQVNWEH